MSMYNQMLTTSDRFNYTMITPQYSPDTTIAISLRHFEKESKAQAEQEYDAEHGPLPEPIADDDESIDIKERTIQKKKRKVRSAIVSRRKSAIYEKKLEDELQVRDNVNADLKTRLSVYQDVLRDIRAKIHAMQRTLESRRDVPKRMRTSELAPEPVHRIPQDSNVNNVFFLEDNTIDDILSISPEQNRSVPAVNKAMTHYRDTDFTSECSDRQISPMLQPQRQEPPVRDVPPVFPGEDNSWKTYFPQSGQQSAAQMLAASFAI